MSTDRNPARYVRTRLHAEGGIGQVWLAHDENLGRDVALKELRCDRDENPAAVARFLAEARITGQLEHPGIVPVYELVEPKDGPPCYAMRFVGGRTLADAIQDYHHKRQAGQTGPLDLRALLGAFVGVANAVGYAHSRGVLHRDLKPQNVALGEYGEVVVLDWGLAKVLGRAEEPTSPLPVTLEPANGEVQTQQG
jgi:serine/threonine protein kinase